MGQTPRAPCRPWAAGRRSESDYRFSCGSGSLARCQGAGRTAALPILGRRVGTTTGPWVRCPFFGGEGLVVPRVSFTGLAHPVTLVHDGGSASFTGVTGYSCPRRSEAQPGPGWLNAAAPYPRISFAGHAHPVTLVRDAGSASFTRVPGYSGPRHWRAGGRPRVSRTLSRGCSCGHAGPRSAATRSTKHRCPRPPTPLRSHPRRLRTLILFRWP